MDFKQMYEKNRETIKYVSGLGLMILLGLLFVINRDNKREDVSETLETGFYSATEATYVTTAAKEDTEGTIFVYICGNVNNPGVYDCPESMRIYEMIELAGGVTNEADVTGIDMAKKATDGQKIYIPAKGETVGYETQDKLVNINSAGVSELTSLPGIGESRANDIIKYRTKNGSFEKIEDIMNVSGIKENLYDKIKDLICV